MSINHLSGITPIFITLVGSTSVGKSCFLFSLGLTISKYPVIDDNWIIQEISSDYKEQIKIWKKQYIESGIIGATDLGENVQLSFLIKSKRSNRKYQVVIADMAGEEIVRYFSNEGTYTRIANDIKMRIRLSSGILLMLEADKIDKQKEIDAWEQLLQTGMFSSIEVCLMKADLLPNVEEMLKITHEKTIQESHLDNRLLYDPSLQKKAENIFSAPKLLKLVNYMRNNAIQSRYHCISSLGTHHNQEILDKFDEFVSYNIFGAIIDILNGLESNFSCGITAKLIGGWKNFIWKSTLQKAEKIYSTKRYREAVEVLFEKKLIADTCKHYSVLHKFNTLLKDIHHKWIQDREKYEELSPEVNSENLAQKIEYFYKEVIDRRELDVEINKYKQRLLNYIKKLAPVDNQVNYSEYVNFLHLQCKTIRDFSQNNTSSTNEILIEIETFFWELFQKQIHDLDNKMIEPPSIQSLKNTTMYVSLYIAIWFTSEASWRAEIDKKCGDLSTICNKMNYVLSHVASCTSEKSLYSLGFSIVQELQKNSQKMGSFINIPNKKFVKISNEIAKCRLIVFKNIPPVAKMNGKQKNLYLNDRIFEKLYHEWLFWSNEEKNPPPESLKKRFPVDLLICPGCLGKNKAISLCDCKNSFWLFRFLHISVEPCKFCRGTGEIAVQCEHCKGKKQRNFA